VKVKQAPLNVVLQVIDYEKFESDLQTAYRELNNESR
jgi:hypothetical protein